MLRSAMMVKLHSVPGLRGLLPFVRTTYVRPPSYVWEDGDGVKHQIHQAEGGEQGDPLMPLCNPRCVGERAVSSEAKGVCFRLSGRCIRSIFSRPFACSLQLAGRAVVGSCRCSLAHQQDTCMEQSCRTPPPPDMDDLGNEVWNPDGIKIFGTPVGSPQCVQGAIHTRLEDEVKLPFHGSRTCSRVGVHVATTS